MCWRRRHLPEALKTFRDGSGCRASGTGRPGNAGWQRDLSVSYNKIGDVLVDQGNLPEAVNRSATAAIRERLAQATRQRGLQRDLSVPTSRSRRLVDQGNLPER